MHCLNTIVKLNREKGEVDEQNSKDVLRESKIQDNRIPPEPIDYLGLIADGRSYTHVCCPHCSGSIQLRVNRLPESCAIAILAELP